MMKSQVGPSQQPASETGKVFPAQMTCGLAPKPPFIAVLATWSQHLV